MAHPDQQDFVSRLKHGLPYYFLCKSVLEVGSLNINGTVRDFFEDCNFTGIDVGEGPCVDVVCPGNTFLAPTNTYDVVCSLECFEHNPYWEETFSNMIRMCKRGGLVFFTCAAPPRVEHGTTRSIPEVSPLTVSLNWDYYRNLTQSDFDQFNCNDTFIRYDFEYKESAGDLYFWGIKK